MNPQHGQHAFTSTVAKCATLLLAPAVSRALQDSAVSITIIKQKPMHSPKLARR